MFYKRKSEMLNDGIKTRSYRSKFDGIKLLIGSCGALFYLSPAQAAEAPADFPVREESKSPFSPSMITIGEIWRNTSGGQEIGSRWNTLTDLSLGINTAAIGGPAGGEFFAQLHWVTNQDTEVGFGDLTGAFNPVSNIMASNQVRAYNIYYKQIFEDERWAFKIGSIAIDDDFMLSDYAGLFINSAFGAMPSQVATPLSTSHDKHSAFPVYSVAAAGLWFSHKASEKLTLQAGLYHGGPGPDDSKNHGFDNDGAHNSSMLVFYEGSYTFDFLGRASTVRIGGDYHFGVFDDYQALNERRDDTERRGLYSFYVIQDIVLKKKDVTRPEIAFFWRVGISPQSDRAYVGKYFDAGVNWFGLLPRRNDDVAGIAISYTGFGREFRQYDGSLAAGETTIELTYRARINKVLCVQIDLQRLYKPAVNESPRVRENASVVGLRVKVAL